MFHSRNTEHHINKIQRSALKLIYNDTPNLSFDELLVKSVSIHQRSLQLLATEISYEIRIMKSKLLKSN